MDGENLYIVERKRRLGNESPALFKFRRLRRMREKGKRTKSKGLRKIQEKEYSTTHPKTVDDDHVVRVVEEPGRDRAAAAAAEPAGAAENTRATTAICVVTTTCPLIDITCHVAHPVTMNSSI